MAVIPLSYLLDALLGDPSFIPHPVVLIGWLISFSERILRFIFPKTKGGEKAAGIVLAVIVPLFVLAFSGSVVVLSAFVSPFLALFFNVLWGWQCLAMKSLKQASMKVYFSLKSGDLQRARRDVSMIVGRDTERLTEHGVTKATVETVAENFSDGVVAPLFYMMLGLAPLALTYKAINTLDSMVGYKNDRYIWFGMASAKLDDAANFIPSRVAAVILILASGMCRMSMKNALKIWRRDRRNHSSPNSAQTESAMAGALGVCLAGDAFYFGKLVKKQFIGDAKRPIEVEDIRRANKLMYAGTAVAVVIFTAVRVAVELPIILGVML